MSTNFERDQFGDKQAQTTNMAVLHYEGRRTKLIIVFQFGF
jgi:hypothetical protein